MRFVPHNAPMPFRKASDFAGRVTRCASLLVCASLLSPLTVEARPAPAMDAGYLSALAAADHFLQAWQAADVESGMVLLSGHAKEAAGTDVVEGFFSEHGASAYEIVRGKALK